MHIYPLFSNATRSRQRVYPPHTSNVRAIRQPLRFANSDTGPDGGLEALQRLEQFQREHGELEQLLRRLLTALGATPNSHQLTAFLKFLGERRGYSMVTTMLCPQIRAFLDTTETSASLHTGGTVATKTDHNGTRQPNHGTMVGLAQQTISGDQGSREPIMVYPNHAPDSSNHTQRSQAQLMGTLGHIAAEDLRTHEAKATWHLLTLPEKSFIRTDEIPLYHKFPKKVGSGAWVTHGTDTLDENASLSAYMLLPKVLTWTGSWASPGEEGSDAALNTQRAKQLAEDPFVPPGSYVVIGDEIHLATRLKKIKTHPFKPKGTPYNTAHPWRPNRNEWTAYFASVDDKPVGYFGPMDTIYFDNEFLKEWETILYDRRDKPPVYAGFTPAYVEHIVMDRDTPQRTFDNLVARLETQDSPCGVVLEGNIKNFTVRYQRDIEPAIKRLARQQKYIVLASDYDGTPPAQLRTKLSALLGRNQTDPFCLDYLRKNYAGEIVGRRVAQQSHLKIPKAFYKNSALVIAFPGMSPRLIDDAVATLKTKKLADAQKPLLLINGFGDGHLPIGILNMSERLQRGFQGTDDSLGTQLIDRIEAEASSPDSEPVYSVDHIHNHLTQLCKNNRSVARQKLRAALMASDPMLTAIGNALDEGIDVRIGTKVTYSAPNLKAYEIGTILKFIGVKGLKQPTTRFLDTFKSTRSG